MAARVVVALRSREVRSALFTAIDSRADLRLAGSATSIAELVSQCRTLEPDVVIVEGSWWRP